MGVTLHRITDKTAARLMEGLRVGKTPRVFSITPARLEAYLQANPEYAAEARPLLVANAKAALDRKGSVHRLTTHCRSGLHPMTGNNVDIDGTHGRRRCRACRLLSAAKASPMDADIAARVKAAIERGANLTQITKGDALPAAAGLIRARTSRHSKSLSDTVSSIRSSTASSLRILAIRWREVS